jgi:methenyltetrahydrofolate cyclohydrolase
VGAPPLLHARVEELLEQLASGDPIPGAGAAAGIVVGMAAALCSMVARASTDWEEAKGVAAQAEALRKRAAKLAHANATAYAEALTAFRLPDELGGEQRDAALGRALARAAEVPLAVAAAAGDAAELAAVIARDGQPAMRGDVVAAGVMSAAAARAAAVLVAVNLGVTEDDPRLAAARDIVEAAARAAAQAERTVELI